MRYLSFKIIAACILLPPILYILTAYFTERHFQAAYTDELEAVYLGDTTSLLDGSDSLRDRIATNIDHYLSSRILIPLGLEVTVTVATKTGKILYPAVFDQDRLSRPTSSTTRTAQENFALMNEGLLLQVGTKFEHNRILSNSVLGGYILLALLLFYAHFKKATGRIDREEFSRRKEIERLQRLERRNTLQLENLVEERARLKSEFDGLKQNLDKEKTKALRNEDELVEEIDVLEKKLNENLLLQDAQQEEILELQEKLQTYEKDRRKSKKQKAKAEDNIRKRFQTLYKNISVHPRAIAGYVDLNEELKLKAEEIVHQLNDDHTLVPIKRKVFGGKGQKTVLEVIFGYKGRLYFRNTEDRSVEVLAIGTKNTQAKELEFLSKL
jgi:hypothetical protein